MQPFLADDACAVLAQDNKNANVLTGFPRMKLWADALEKLETPVKGFKQVRLDSDFNKFFVPFKTSSHNPVPVRSVFVLNKTNSDSFDIEELRGMDRVPPIHTNTYRINF